MASETRAFPTCDVISSVTGYMVTERGISAVYEVLNWMTGESLFTHQLPRVGKEAWEVFVKLHPDAACLKDEAENVNHENWHGWADRWIARYGATLTVPKMTADDHERIDPLSELAEKIDPSRIVVVKP